MKTTSVDLLYFSNIAPKRYAKNPIRSDKNEILQSMISQIYLVIQPIISYNLRDKMKPLIEAAKYFPSCFSLSNYTHASLYVIVKSNKKGRFAIKIEYGGYDNRREGDYEGQVHYFNGKDGLRFIKMTANDIIKFNNENNQMILCNFEYEVSVQELLYYTQFCGKFHSWNKNDFDLTKQNCQLFVEKVVKLLGCTRRSEEQKSLSYGRMYIPKRILYALAENEKLFSNLSQKRNFEEHKQVLFGDNYIPYNFFNTHENNKNDNDENNDINNNENINSNNDKENDADCENEEKTEN